MRSKTTFSRSILVAKNKGKSGLKQIERFKLQGDTLITEPIRAKPITLKLVRVE